MLEEADIVEIGICKLATCSNAICLVKLNLLFRKKKKIDRDFFFLLSVSFTPVGGETDFESRSRQMPTVNKLTNNYILDESRNNKELPRLMS